MGDHIRDIARHFIFDGVFEEAAQHGSGHINDTYAVCCKTGTGHTRRYILQKINSGVFKCPEKMMENIEAITAYLRKRVILLGGDPERETLNLIPALTGQSFYKTADGDYWRAYAFIENARTYDVVSDPKHFNGAGKALGKFQRLLADFPVGTLHETIPAFHDTPKRYRDFIKALENDAFGRAGAIEAEIGFAKERAAETSILLDLANQGKLPLRVAHNDTKFNNVMIDDSTGEGICIVDLDTVMPGLSLYDYGDAIRSGTNPAPEDEKDLSKVTMDLTLYECFTRGYIAAVGGFLTALELEYLPFAAKLMTFECGVRFLADYLNGDIYFKTHYKGQNLDRARTQFKLVEDMEEKAERMKEIVEEITDAPGNR